MRDQDNKSQNGAQHLKPSALGRRVKQLRTRNKLTQLDLYRKSGVVPNVISRLEIGVQQSVNAHAALKIAKALGVTLEYLLGGSKNER